MCFLIGLSEKRIKVSELMESNTSTVCQEIRIDTLQDMSPLFASTVFGFLSLVAFILINFKKKIVFCYRVSYPYH